ncbi:MAG: Hsp70 family protein [Deltaproteobacteria bacterium]|nr:Hsp70 family protein [Deltaproteobacteria bacterium]
MGQRVGIDLGTTNSSVSIFSLQSRTLGNAEGKDFTPSIVARVDDNAGQRFVVGEHAKNLQKLHPAETVSSVKRLMGRFFDDDEIQKFLVENRFSYKIIGDKESEDAIKILLKNESYSPEEISAEILKKLVRDASRHLNEPIEEAVVTVPAYFNDLQKFATRAACELAGLKLKRLLAEPTAAAITFDFDEDETARGLTLMVFDLGGGTFDISILTTANGHYMELAKGGDNWLGGDDIDQLLIQHVFLAVEKENPGVNVSEQIGQLAEAQRLRFFVEMKEKVELAKITLSTELRANIDCFGILKKKDGQFIDIDIDISREEFDTLIQPLVEKTRKITHALLDDIHFSPELIDYVLMVGGSSLIPAFQSLLIEIFGEGKVKVHPRPLLAVSEGAAKMAHRLDAKDTDDEQTKLHFMHSVAHDYYIQLANAKRLLLVKKNSPLPLQVKEELSFVSESQFLGRIRIFNLVDNVFEPVGEVWYHRYSLLEYLDNFGLISGQRKVRFEFCFQISEDNILSVELRDTERSEKKQHFVLSRSGIELQLLQKLENYLALLASQSIDLDDANDLIVLSETIVRTILQISNPLTGVVNHEKKRLAQKQLSTFQQLQLRDLHLVSQYQFHKIARETLSVVLNDEQKAKLDELLHQYRVAMIALEDADFLEKQGVILSDYLKSIFGDLAYTVTRAANCALLVEKESKAEAARIRKLISECLQAYARGDMQDLENRKKQLYLYEVMLDGPIGKMTKFDRDVERTVAT